MGDHRDGQEQAKLDFRHSETFLKEHPLINKFFSLFFFKLSDRGQSPCHPFVRVC